MPNVSTHRWRMAFGRLSVGIVFLAVTLPLFFVSQVFCFERPKDFRGLKWGTEIHETSPYYLRDPILDLEGNGLNGKHDFVCFDAIHQAIGIEMAIEIGQEVSKEVNFSISWLKGHVQEGCVLVYLVDSE